VIDYQSNQLWQRYEPYGQETLAKVVARRAIKTLPKCRDENTI